MGVNNLFSFLRQTAVEIISVASMDNDEVYDLYIDLAIIVVPLMQRARNVEHFTYLLSETFGGTDSSRRSNDVTTYEINDNNILDRDRNLDDDNNDNDDDDDTSSTVSNELVELILRARSVSMYLDMLSPRMKIETHNYRNSRNNGFTNHNNLFKCQNLEQSFRTFDAFTKFDVHSQSLEQYYNKHLSKQSYYRPRFVSAVDDNNINNNNNGGGNNGNNNNNNNNDLNKINDVNISINNNNYNDNNNINDEQDDRTNVRYNVVKLRDIREIIPEIILCALLRKDRTLVDRCVIETDVIGEGEIKCMRSAIIDKFVLHANSISSSVVILSNDNDVILMMLMHQPKIVTDPNVTTLFYRVTVNDASVKSIVRITIHRIVMDSSSVLRQFPTCERWRLLLWLICCCGTDFVSPIRPVSPARRVDIFNACLRNDRSLINREKFTMDNFLNELKRFVGLIDSLYTSRGSSNDYDYNIIDSKIVVNRNKRRLRLVASWVIRLYWNLLYLIDLPIDFFKQPRFPSDSNVSVNCYVPNEYISIFAILSSLSDGELDELRRVIRELLNSSSINYCEEEEVEEEEKEKQSYNQQFNHRRHSSYSLRSALKNVLFHDR